MIVRRIRRIVPQSFSLAISSIKSLSHAYHLTNWSSDIFGSSVNSKFIINIHKYILNGLKPNLTFVLKVSAKASRRRLLKRKTRNRYDNFKQSFYDKVQNSFLRISKNKKNYYILESSKNDNLLEKKIFEITCKYLNL